MDEQRRSKDAATLRFTRLYESNVLGIIVCEVGGSIREATRPSGHDGYSQDEIAAGEVTGAEMTPPESRSLTNRPWQSCRRPEERDSGRPSTSAETALACPS